MGRATAMPIIEQLAPLRDQIAEARGRLKELRDRLIWAVGWRETDAMKRDIQSLERLLRQLRRERDRVKRQRTNFRTRPAFRQPRSSAADQNDPSS